MAKLGNYGTVKLALPSTANEPEEDKAYVTVRDQLLLGDVSSFTQDSDDAEKAVALLSQLIVEWNFTVDGSPDGERLPINKENVNKLSLEDFAFLSEWMGTSLKQASGGLDTEEKKTSTVTSIPVTETPQT